jgi:uncharacterized membrane protein
MKSLLALAILAASAPSFAAPTAARFGDHVMPVFERRCSFCHSRGNNYGGLVLERDIAFAQLVGVPALSAPMVRVHPRDPDRSYLMRKIDASHAAAGGTGTRMPPGWGMLTRKERDTLWRWIKSGARND